MRILLTMNLPYVPAHGGANKSNRYLLEALARQQHNVRAVVPALATPSRLTHAQFRDELAAQGLHVTAVDGVDSFTLNGVEVQAVVEPTRLRAHLIEQIRAFAPDWVLVSSEDPSQNLLDGALQASPARVIYLAHTTSFLPFGPQAFFSSAARARRFAQAAAIMAISEYVAGYIRQWSGLTATFLPLCLYGAGPFPNFGQFDQGYVTMINPCAVKGIAIFLALARQMPQVPFAAVASWGTTSQDRAALAELPNVRLLEPQDEIDRIFAQTRVLLVPSLWDEAFGRVAVEAMLRGIPVLASDLAGLREAGLGATLLLPVRPITQFAERLDENLLPELMVPDQDIGSWQAALTRLLTDRAAYEQRAAAARAVAHQFVEGLSIAPFEDFLRRLAARPAPGQVQTAGRPAERKDQDKAVEQNSLPEELASLTPEQRALLMLRLKKRAAAREQKDPPADPIKPAARDGDLPLSFAQQRLWFLDQLEPGSPFYNTFTVVRLTGPLNVAVLKRSLSEVVRRHEVLRTRFPAVEGHLRQVIEPARPLGLPVADLSGLPAAEREAVAQRQAMAEARRPFDLAHGPLLRVGLLRLAAREHILALTMHHIISDGWSAAIFIQEVAALYEAFSAGRPSPLPELPIQYADFAVWQREWLQGSGARGQGDKETRRQGDKETRPDAETQSPTPNTQHPTPMEVQLAYWKRQLADLPELALPTDEPRPPVQRFLGAMHTRVLPPALTAGINALSQREDITLFMTLLGAFQALLARYSGQTDIVVGSPIANRNRSQIQGLIGFFVNMLVMRTDLTGNPTFRELLGRVREVALGAYAHQDLPFEQLVEELHPQRDLGRNPLFQVAFVLQNVPQPALSPGELTMSPVAIESTTAKFDLTLNVVADAHELILMMEYSTDLYEAATIARMLEHFQILLDGVVAAPWRRLPDLPLLSDAERRQLLVDWNDTWAEYPLDSCMHRLFEAQAQRTPDAVAMVFDRPPTTDQRPTTNQHPFTPSPLHPFTPSPLHPVTPQHLTYCELNARANQLAHYLQMLGVGPEVLVAICMERSLGMLIGMLGILKAGGAYIPLDPAHPAERLAFMLDDARPAVLLTQQHIYDLRFTIYDFSASDDQLRELKTQNSKLKTPVVVCIDTHATSIAGRPEQNSDSGVRSDNLAYVIYTSGSTGAPKGVLVPHRGLCSMATSEARILHVDSESRVLQLASFSFDASMWDLLMALPIGAALCMASEESRLPGPELARLLDQHAITIATMTPSMLATLPAQRYPALHTIIAIGEACSAEIVARWAPGRRFINGYGPTEATIGATLGECADVSRRPSIGRPLLNTQIYLLDPAWQPAPIGVAGEIYIGGVGVTRGYLNRPDLTAERFVPNPFVGVLGDGYRVLEDATPNTRHPKPNTRLYRTGDLARYRPNGEIEFLGRSDQQVKVRGFRIELGEIEAALAQHPDVREAVVMVREDAPGGRRLVAYIVPKIEDRGLKIEDSGSDAREPLSSILYPLSSELRRFLQTRLPAYMVPVAFVPLDALPLTHSGKVDRRALPAPDGQRPALAAPFMPPRTPLEANIAEVWRAVLQLDQVGIHDNFFDLGGHSLRLVEVQSGLRALLSREIAIIDLFKYPTVGALAAFLRQEGAAEPQPDRPAPVPSSGAIAIIAMSGRFPDAPSVEAFWHNLCDGVESVRFFSDEQLRAVGVDPATLQDSHYVKARAVLERIEWFDAAFFGLTPREAELIDPQQRLFLECAWEALERAGYAPLHTPGRVGVFAGTSMNSYVFNLYTNPDVINSVGNFQAAIGNDKDFLPTRVSYKLNLKGPSVAVQTACSTSLVAVHLACQSLRDGECDMALAGGVSILVPQVSGHLYTEGGIGSADGHCRAFDAQASGMIGGSGAGVVVLKRLSDALADGDAILALIRGSAINNDGSDKVGYTAPSVAGQAAVISAAQALAGVDPATIGYVEAHGTATPLGDPIEVAALTTAFRRHTTQTGFCALGSVKTNIGHLDAAAGVAGLIKAVLALQHQRIPPSLHFEQPNPNIDFVSSPFYVNTALSEWQAGGAPRRAGVSSFGIGGTNAHVVLEEAPPLPTSPPALSWQLLLLSAKSPAALDQATIDLAAALQAQPDLDLADVAFTTQVGRSPFAHRRMLVARDLPDAAAALTTRDPSRLTSALAPDLTPPVVFLFPGQGTQYPNMGRELYESEPVFRAVVDQCSELLAPHLGLDLREVLYPDLKIEDRRWRIEGSESSILYPLSSILDLDQTQYAQPALFVIEYALAQLWISWGVRPAALIGHSIGEYVAACLAGVFSLEDALALVAARGRLIQNLPSGAMLNVALEAEALWPLLGPELDLAAINAPSLCVVSGPSEAVERLERQLTAQGVESRRLHTSHAFHSAMLDPVRDAFRTRVAQVQLSPPQLPYLSNLSGTWVTADEATDPAYWAAQLRQGVRFADGIAELLREQARVLLEVGPGHTLGALARQQAGRERLVLATLPAAQELLPARAVLLRTLGSLWLASIAIDWAAVHAHEQRRRVLLPTYPFERQRYWVEAQPQQPQRAALHKKADIADWFYVPSWKRVPPLKPFKPQSAARQPARWLVFADGCGIGAQVLKRLEAAGQELIEVRAGTHFDRLGERVYTLDPGQRADYDALLGELRAAGQIPRTIVHLWSVTPQDAQRSPGESFDTCQDLGLYSLLFLAQALEKQRMTDPLDLVVVSNNLQAVSGAETICPEKATVLAPCKVIPQEYPNLRCRSIDVVLPDAANGDAPLIEQLLAEIAAPAADTVVAYRGPHRWVQGVEAMPLDDDGAGRTRLRERGVYLITGGLGNIGLALAGELARAVQARLVLLGRAALPARAEWDGWLAAHSEDDEVSRKIRGVRALEAHGAEVELLSADVADEAQMRAAIARAEERFGAVQGVIHAAGVVGEKASRTIQETDRDACAIHFQPKVRGLYVLEKVLHGRTLDFCLLQSSLSAVLGGLGFAAYAAANVFMDAFAQRQRSPAGAIPWMSVNWDGWDFQSAAPASLAMHPGEGVEAFTRLLALETLPQVMVAASDLQARLDQWVRLGGAAEAAPGEAVAQHPRPSLQGDYVAPRDPIEQTIAGIWQTSLGIEQVGVHDSFFELGGHSLLGTRVISRIREAFQVELPLRALFETPTVAGLALAVAQQQGSHLSKIDRVDRGSAEQLLATLDQLSEEHVDSLLDAMLTKEDMKR